MGDSGYFLSVAAIANLWRTTGIPTKLMAAAAKLYGEEVSMQFFRKLPGRPLKGRWGAIHSVEALLRKAMHYLGAVFKEALMLKDK